MVLQETIPKINYNIKKVARHIGDVRKTVKKEFIRKK